MKKTYVLKGMIEAHKVFDAGGARIRIHFTGGSLGSWGLSPARFTTSNPVLQKIIESSRLYKEKVVQEITETAEMPVMKESRRNDINVIKNEDFSIGDSKECSGFMRADDQDFV